jgi:hypothetical protein
LGLGLEGRGPPGRWVRLHGRGDRTWGMGGPPLRRVGDANHPSFDQSGAPVRASAASSAPGNPLSGQGRSALKEKTCLCYSWRRRATRPLCGGGSAARRGGQSREAHVSTEPATPEQDPRLSGENADPRRQERAATTPGQGPVSSRGGRATLGRTASTGPVGRACPLGTGAGETAPATSFSA